MLILIFVKPKFFKVINFICFNLGLLLNEEDDSLFSSSKKPVEKPDTKSKGGLFDDEDESSSDLFSSSKLKLNKKPLKDTKIDLFDEAGLDDEDSSLFGSASKKSEKTKDPPPVTANAAKVEAKSDSKVVKPGTKDIFDDSSDEDIFAKSKKTILKNKTESLFNDDGDSGDNDDIFGKPKPSKETAISLDKEKPTVKKAVTKDLKKTAEKIVEDPLSLLQDD